MAPERAANEGKVRVMGSEYGVVDSMSGLRLSVLRGSGDIQMMISRGEGDKMRLRLTVSEARQLSRYFLQAADTEQMLLNATQAGD